MIDIYNENLLLIPINTNRSNNASNIYRCSSWNKSFMSGTLATNQYITINGVINQITGFVAGSGTAGKEGIYTLSTTFTILFLRTTDVSAYHFSILIDVASECIRRRLATNFFLIDY